MRSWHLVWYITCHTFNNFQFSGADVSQEENVTSVIFGSVKAIKQYVPQLDINEK